MFPFPFFIKKDNKPKPGDIVFKLGDLAVGGPIVDSGPFEIPINNPGSLQVLSDANGSYIDFTRGDSKYLTMDNTPYFRLNECVIRIRCSSSVITNGNTSLSGLVDNSNGLLQNSCTIGIIGSDSQVAVRNAGTYKLIKTVVAAQQEILDITVSYKSASSSGCYMDIVGYDRVSDPYVAGVSNFLTYIGSLSSVYSSQTYQMKGKLYSLEIRAS